MDDLVEEIGIDKDGRLYVKPSSEAFPMIYREAMEVHWNSSKKFLYGAVPRKWGYVDWYRQILKAAKEQGCKLVLSGNTRWVNISGELQSDIENACNT